MNSLEIAPDATRRKWNSAGERFAEYKRLVGLVAVTYTASRNLPTIVALNLDPTPTSRSPKWSPQAAEYICDVELAVKHALKFKLDADREELQSAWKRFLEDDTKVDKTQQRLIGILAPVFFGRGLHPAKYFKPHRVTPKDKQCQ